MKYISDDFAFADGMLSLCYKANHRIQKKVALFLPVCWSSLPLWDQAA